MALVGTSVPELSGCLCAGKRAEVRQLYGQDFCGDHRAPMKIAKAVRQDIIDGLRLERTNWSGRLDPTEFLSRIWDLEQLPSDDGRFKTAAGDIWQHTVNNPSDWPDDWIFSDSRFNLLGCDDEIFLRFLCEMVHPVVRPDAQEAEAIVQLINESLVHSGFEVVARSRVAGRTVWAPRSRLEGIPAAVSKARDFAASFNAAYLVRQIARIESAVPHDPDLAIGTAKELVETCCKTHCCPR